MGSTLAENAQAQGRRLYEHPQASSSLVRAQQDMTPVVTPPISLFQGGTGFAGYFPVGTREQQRGFVNAVFRAEPLVLQALSPRVQQYYRFSLTSPQGALFVHSAQPNPKSSFYFERPVSFEGQNWLIQLEPSMELRALTLNSTTRNVMGLIGLAASLLASLLTFRFLKEHEARSQLASLVEASGDLIALFDAHGRIRYVNAAGRRLLGCTPDARSDERASDVLGKHWSSVLEPRERPANPDLSSTPSIAAIGGSSWLLRPVSGAPLVDTEIVTFPVQSLHREILFGMIARDTRERTLLQRQLVQAQKMEAVGTLASGVAHDFNNLLTAIIGNAEVAKLDANPGSELDLSLNNILDASDLAAGLTAKLLAFSRRNSPSAEPYRLDDAVHASARLLRRLLREDLVLEVVTAAPTARLIGDPAELQQVLMNLVVNARDAIEHNGRIQVCTSLHSENTATAVLEVIDNGCGMTADVLASVFEPFFTTKPSGQGTGLGLAMVKSAVDRLDGTIDVESKLGAGTRIAITLPIDADPLSLKQHQLVAHQRMRRTTQANILLVEDSSAIRRVLHSGLVRAGYNVVAKESGAAALREFDVEDVHFDALLTDVVMPGIDGVSLARVFREHFPTSAVIFISGYEEEGAALDRARTVPTC